MNLLGNIVCYRANGEWRAGRVVEVEAYLGQIDPACHIRPRLTERVRELVGRSGIAYVFTAYGLHRCLNVLTLSAPPYGCVLFRAVEPWDLRTGRPLDLSPKLAAGPGLVCEYLGIDKSLNGHPFDRVPLLILDSGKPPKDIETSPRIGISKWKEKSLRYYDSASKYVSKHAGIS